MLLLTQGNDSTLNARVELSEVLIFQANHANIGNPFLSKKGMQSAESSAQAGTPVSGQPERHAVLLAIALHSDHMHLLSALTGIIVDAARVRLKLRSNTDSAGNGTARSNLCHHVVLASHLPCRG